MKEYQESSMEALDFSRDSGIRDSLLARIKDECFDSLEDDELDFLNAAGPAGGAGSFLKYQTDRKKR